MEEDSDRNRDSVDGGLQLLEASNTDVARAAGRVDSYSASFSGTDGTYLYVPRGGSLISSATVAMRIYPTSSAADQILLSADEVTAHGPYLALVPSAGNLKVKGIAYYGDGRGDVSVTSTSTMTLNAWHLVVWGYDKAEASDFLTTSDTGRVMYVQIDGGARDKVGLAFFPTVPFNDLILGQRKGTGAAYTKPFSGRVDQLTFAGRTWDDNDTLAFYNNGSGLGYPFSGSATASLNAGLAAYYKLDEASGTRYDAVGIANLSLTGTVSQMGGKVGYAAGPFTSATHYLQTTDGGSATRPAGDFSLAAWFYPNSTTAGDLISKYNSGSTFDYYVAWNASQQLGFVVNLATTDCIVNSGTGITTSAWHLVVVDYTDATKTCAIRVDNGTRTTATGSGALTTSTDEFSPNSLTVGQFPFDGRADEVGFWSKALSAAEAGYLWNSGSGRTYPF